MASRDLELLMAPYERALANAHAAGGAIVALKKVARRGIDDDRSLLPPVVVPAGRGRDPAGSMRPESLYFSEMPLVEYLHGQKSKHILRSALLCSLAWHVLLEHARDRRGGSVWDGPILEHAQDSQHG